MTRRPWEAVRIDVAWGGCLLACMAACATGDRTSTVTPPTIERLPSGAVHITNHGPSEWPDTSGWKLVLERVIPSAPSGVGLLASPRNIVATADGGIFVLDRRPARLLHFDSTGRLVGAIGQQGAGPGEYADFGDLALFADTLIVVDRGNNRLVVFSTGGVFLRSVPGGRGPLAGPATTDGRIPLWGYLARRPGTPTDIYAGSGVRRFRTDGSVVDSLFYPPEPRPRMWTLIDATHDLGASIPFTPSRVYAFDTRGHLIWGDQNRYRIIVSTTGGDTLRVIDATAASVTIPDSVRREALAAMVAATPWLEPIAALDDIPTGYPAWTDVRADPVGNIWVLRPGPAGVGAVFDVFAPDGGLRGSVPAPFDELDYSWWTTDHLYRIGASTNGEPQLEVWRITRGSP